MEESKNCDSHHEVKPNGFGKPMQAYQQGAPAQMQEVAREISGAIEAASSKGRIYADTSHGFIKGFGWLLMDMVDEKDIGVIILKRDKQAVVKSTFRAQSGPMKNLGRRYTLTPDRLNPFRRPPGFMGLGPRPGYALSRGLHFVAMKGRGLRRRLGLSVSDTQFFERYQKAAIDWYWEETYALGDAFREKFPECQYLETTTEDLNRPEFVRDMFDYFGLEWGDHLSEKIGIPTNLKL